MAAIVMGAAGGPAEAEDGARAGTWLLRGRALGVLPDESSTISAIGGRADAENTIVPELDLTYFATDSIAVELIAAVTKHDVEAHGTMLGTVPLGSAWLLPPTLTVQYHVPGAGGVSPYLGAGVNYTHFFDADPPAAGAVRSISYDDSFGPALQAGVDVWVNDRWAINLDVKKVWLNTDVSINGGAIEADVDLDPWLVGVGVAYRF
jgi:outer membrane protein